jgi:hypothetical protein
MLNAGAAGAVGAGAGAVAGAPVAAAGLLGASAYGAFKVAQEVLNSPYWNSLSARAKIAIADAVRNGALAKAQTVGRAADIVAPAASRYEDVANPSQ